MDDEKYWEQFEDLTLDDEDGASLKNVDLVSEAESAPSAQEQSADSQNEEEIGTEARDVVNEEKLKTEARDAVGKFKDADALLEAYNNLEKEFTKKCQRLSALERDKALEDKENEEKLNEKLSKFLLSNGEATKYSEELKEKVKNDDSLKKMDDPFSFVWAEMVFNQIRGNKSDEAVKNYILGNDDLKNAVIENYVNQLAENKSPIIISAKGNRVAEVATQKPSTLEEAKNLLFDLLS